MECYLLVLAALCSLALSFPVPRNYCSNSAATLSLSSTRCLPQSACHQTPSRTLQPFISLPPLLRSAILLSLARDDSTTPPPQPAAGVPIGFHIQLGHNATVPPGRTLQLGNYIGVGFLHLTLIISGMIISPPQLKSGLVATGPLSFEAYNGSFCPPVTGYYYLGANVQLTTSLSQPGEGEGEEGPLVTISVCLAGSCSNDRIA